ncbi:MAG: family 43 glycosylhydrolase [Dictyoglomaceae bacterium]|nr:family 43 glycosylhydrolase [Dictyoglomaceae bacterium]
MRKFCLLLSIIFLLGVTAMFGDNKVPKYKNPLNVYKVADPFILSYKGKYYLYATSEKGAGPQGGFEVWESNNLVDWIYRGWAYESDEKSWGKESFWAPEVLYKDGKFYLFYSARGYIKDKKTLRICLAVSNSPLGPFKDLKAPLFDPGYATIDAHPFVDDDGKIYLYFSRDVSENPTSDIYVVRLSEDLLNTIGEPQFLLSPTQLWEKNSKWNEAPFVVKYNKKYYLFYSGNFFASPEYSVGYAISSSPLGPFIKAEENPILRRTEHVSGPGHNSIIRTPDGKEYFMVYHTQMKREGTHLRQLAIDRILFTPDGKVKVLGPTNTPQAFPSGVPRPKKASSDNFSSKDLDFSRWIITGSFDYSLTERKGYLRIKTIMSDILSIISSPLDVANIFTQYTWDNRFEISTKIEIISEEEQDRAGLIVFDSYNHYLELIRTKKKGKILLEFVKKNEEEIEKYFVEIPNKKACYLKLKTDGKKWYAYYKFEEKENWTSFGKEIKNDFDLIRVGITAYSPYSIGGSVFDFDYFNYLELR